MANNSKNPSQNKPTRIEQSQDRLLTKNKGPIYRLGLALTRSFEKLIAFCSPLGNPPVYDKSAFPWVDRVEREWRTIRTELDHILKRRQELPAFQDILPGVETITRDQQWKTYFLLGYGMDCELNRAQCPQTARILDRIPGIKTAFFSILSPKKHIPPHRGPYNGILRYHLGLVVPEPREQCRIRVGDQIHHWNEGESFIFDDTFNHQVWNNTGGLRVVLFVDFVRPLRFPMNLLNRGILAAGNLTTMLRRARKNQRNWVRKYYQRTKKI